MYRGKFSSQDNVRKKPVRRRRRKLNKYFLVTLSLFLLLGVAGGATIAYLITEGGTVTSSFIPGSVTCTVNDDLTVTVDGNTTAYVRAAVIINWENAEGHINGTAPKAGTDYTVDPGEGWSWNGDYFYYDTPVSTVTSPVVTVTKHTYLEGFDLSMVVLAEAIQADGMGADSAVEAWNIAQAGHPGN